MMIELTEDEDGDLIHEDDGPTQYVASETIAKLEGVSVSSAPGTRLIGSAGQVLGYVAAPPRIVAQMINGTMPAPVEAPPPAINEVILDDLDFSVRTSNVFKTEGIRTVSDLTQKSEAEMLRMPNFGAYRRAARWPGRGCKPVRAGSRSAARPRAEAGERMTAASQAAKHWATPPRHGSFLTFGHGRARRARNFSSSGNIF